MQPEGWGGHQTEGALMFNTWTGVPEGYQQVMAQPPASCPGRGARQEEGTVQAGDSSAQKSVRFQPAGTEGIGRCAPGPWAVAGTSPKPGNPERARRGTGGHANTWDRAGRMSKRIQNGTRREWGWRWGFGGCLRGVQIEKKELLKSPGERGRGPSTRRAWCSGDRDGEAGRAGDWEEKETRAQWRQGGGTSLHTPHPSHGTHRTHVITLTPTPDTLVGSACDPETLACSGRRAVIDAY